MHFRARADSGGKVVSETGLDTSTSAQGIGRDLLILLLLCVVTAALAWPTLHTGIWLDEYLSINSSTAPDMVTVITNCYGRQDDYHPPLFYIVLNSWMKLFGTGDVAVKIPSLCFGMATIPALYWLGRSVHSARVGLLSALFFAISPLANFLTCQCRGYALATLLSTLCLVFFVRLQDDRASSMGARSRFFDFAGVALAAAALCYSEYVGCVLIPSLGLGTLLVCARQYLRGADTRERKQSVNRFVRCIAALLLASAMFAVWIPSVIKQAPGALYVNRTPLSRFPEVFFWNVMNMLPTHIFFGSLILLVLTALYGIKYIAGRAKNNSDSASGLASFDGTPMPNTDALIVLWCAAIIPSCLMGYITNWWVGYFRYIYPFSPAAWVLLAVAMVLVFYRQADASNKKSSIALAGFLSALSAINIWWILFHAQIPNSGLHSVAQSVEQGNFDNTALIVAPEVIGPTIGYYLPESVQKAHHFKVFGYAKWDDALTPAIIPDMAKAWLPDTLVADTLEKIDQLPAQGFRFFALARDSDKQIELLSSERMPRKKRLAELITALNSKYRLLSTKYYPAAMEDVTVTIYALPR